MKNKKFTYVLGVLVVGIWGLIIYRIFNALAGDDADPHTEHMRTKETLTDYATIKDTTHLLLNYRDPFAEKKAEAVEIPINKLMVSNPKPTIQKPVINWSAIKYSGFVHNPGSKKIIAMLSINGKEVMLSEGETSEQVKLIKNFRDSIKISYQGATKFIILNKAL